MTMHTPLASAERLATSGLTNEEIIAGLAAVCGEFARRGILVVVLSDPSLTHSQHDRAAKLMAELSPKRDGEKR